MTNTDCTIRKVDVEKDAEQLAKMWNLTDAQWPGTWAHGVAFTREIICEQMRESPEYTCFVAEIDGTIAGYCSVSHLVDEPDTHYIGLLNVSPLFQKKGIGKKLLLAAVDNAFQTNQKQIDIATWPGNTKALPLYKKCGFFWKADTSVYMNSFIPSILRLEYMQDFFAKNDWYTTLQRELHHEYDKEKWHDVPCYTYIFQNEKEQYSLRYDTTSKGMCSIETPDVHLSLHPEKYELLEEENAKISLNIHAAGEKDIEAKIYADIKGDDSWEKLQTCTVKAGETYTKSAKISVPDSPIEVLCVIDGKEYQLKCSFKKKKALNISCDPTYKIVTCGTTNSVTVNIHNATDTACEIEMHSIAPDGITVHSPKTHITCPAKTTTGISCDITAVKEGVFSLPLSLYYSFPDSEEKKTLKAPVLDIFARKPGRMLCKQNDDSIRVITDHYVLTLQNKGGRFTLHDLAQNKCFAGCDMTPVPPGGHFSDYTSGKYTCSYTNEGSAYILHAKIEDSKIPGLVFHKKYTIYASGLIECESAFENKTAKTHTAFIRTFAEGGEGAHPVVIPFSSGITKGCFDVFPGPFDATQRNAENFAEQWIATETAYKTVGVFWQNDAEKIFIRYATTTVFSKEYECAPHSQCKTGKVSMFICDGNWQTVRKMWQMMNGKTPEELLPEQFEIHSSLAIQTEPKVIAFAEKTKQFALEFHHRISRCLSGDAFFSVPDSWKIDCEKITYKNLNWKNPTKFPVEITAPEIPAVSEITLHTQTDTEKLQKTIPCICIGDDSKDVSVETAQEDDKEIWTLANGIIDITTCPQFAGTVTAIRTGETNHLFSAFPKSSFLQQVFPFYGGIEPFLQLGSEHLYKENFAGEKIEQHDENGICWKGIRHKALITDNKQLHGLEYQCDILTCGNSNVVKYISRVINSTNAQWEPELGCKCFVQPDGTHEKTRLFNDFGQFGPSDYYLDIGGCAYGAATNIDTGKTIMLIGDRPDVRIYYLGKDGGHLRYWRKCTLHPQSSVEVISYIIIADDTERAKLYAALHALR